MKTLRIAFAAAAMLCMATGAFALGKGSSLFSIQLGNGTADLVQPGSTAGYITAFSVSELEPKVEFSHLMSDDYAFTMNAGIGMYSETDKPGDAALPGAPDVKTTVSSFFVRVGGDRIVKVGDRSMFYFGPGVEYWSGKYKYEADTFEEESETTTRLSLSGRVGGIMMIGENWGFTCNVGRVVGIASAEWDGAKANWTPSSTNGSGGIVFHFGSN